MQTRNKVPALRAATLIAAMTCLSQTALAEDAITPSWNISGWINESMSYYDDGEGSDMVQLSDNGTTLGSRITFSGTASLMDGLNAGFDVTIEPFSGNPNFTGNGNQITPLVFSNQDNLDSFNGGDIGLLGTSVFFGGDWGKVTVGLQSMPTDNIGVLGDPSMTIWSGVGAMFRGSGFFMRGNEADYATNSDGAAIGNTWGSFIQCMTIPGLGIGIDCNGVYRNGIRYDLPAMGPVSIAVGYANDDIYDIAAKVSGKVGRLDGKFHIGYAYNADGGANVADENNANADTDTEMLTVQIGLMDPETGLFGAFTWQHEEANGDVSALAEDETDAYYTKLGIRKAFTPLGDTAFYVEYGQYNDQFGALGQIGVTGSEVTRTGAALEQYFGSKVILYGKYEQLDLDVDGTDDAESIYDDIDELNLVSLGVTYFF
ncbi:porin [Porticoccus sp.]